MHLTRKVGVVILVGLGLAVAVVALLRGPSRQAREVAEAGLPLPAVRSSRAKAPAPPPAPAAPQDSPPRSVPPALSGGGVELECLVPGLVGEGFGILVASDGNPTGAPFEEGGFRAVVSQREGDGIFRLAADGEWEVSWRYEGGVVRCEVTPEARTWGLQGRAIGLDAWPADTSVIVRGCDGLADIEPDGSFYLQRRDPEPCTLQVWLRAQGKLASGDPFPIGLPTTGADMEVEIRLPPPSALRRMTDEEVERLEQRVEVLAIGCEPEETCYRALQEERRQLQLHRASAGAE